MKGYPSILFVIVSVYFITLVAFNTSSLYSYDYKPSSLLIVVFVLSLVYSISLYISEIDNDLKKR